MNLGDMKTAMNTIVQDTSLQPLFADIINAVILEIAADLDLPSLRLITPTPLTVTTAAWIYDLPENYQKRLFRCRDEDYNRVVIHRHMDTLDFRDIDHDETGDNVRDVAVVDTGTSKQIGIYPLANDTLWLWYYRTPALLVADSDVCDCIPPEFQERVIFPKAIIKCYQKLQDQVENFDPKPLQYWEGKAREGLYGSPMGPIGFVNWIVKLQGGIRRRGGRDPVGARYYA